MNYLIKKVLILISFLICFSLLIPILYFSGKTDRPFIVCYCISKNIENKSINPTAFLINSTNYIHSNVKQETMIHSKKYTTSYKILLNGVGTCDEQSDLLLHFAYLNGYRGRLIFLRGEDSISQHSVCEVKIQNKYCLLDPFYGYTFKQAQNQLAGMNDLIKNQTLLKNKKINNDYKALYQLTFPPKIAKYYHLKYTSREQFYQSLFKKMVFSLWYKRSQITFKNGSFNGLLDNKK